MHNNSKVTILLVLLITLSLTLFGCGKKENESNKPKSNAQPSHKLPELLSDMSPELFPDPSHFDDVTNAEYIAKENALWIQDYEEAIKLASEKGVDIFINFTGFDLLSRNLKIKKEVFSQQAFIDDIQNYYVLLKIDDPMDESITSEETKAKNDALRMRYGVNSFPTIILADAAGIPYAITSYKEGGPKKYLEHIHELHNTKEQMLKLLIKADETTITGIEKAKLIDEALSLIPSKIVDRFYRDRIDQIIELDSENKASLSYKYKLARRVDDIYILVSQLQHEQNKDTDYNKIIELSDAVIEEFEPQGKTLQTIYLVKSNAYYSNNNKDDGKKTLQMALDAAPESELAEYIKKIMVLFYTEE